MNLVYLILAHKRPCQLTRLINALNCENVTFVVHVDKRASLREFTSDVLPHNVYFLTQRCIADWGSYGLVQAALNGLKYIQQRLPSVDRVLLLSGQDYPIKSKRYINCYLKANKEAIFLQHFRLPYPKWLYGGILRFPAYDQINNMLSIYAGSQWMSFPGSAIKIIFDFLHFNPEFITYFKSVRVPDESFFQTLFLNCDEPAILNNLKNHTLHLIKWDAPYINPRILKEQNYTLIKRSKALFARKFDIESFPHVMDMVDEEILNECKNKHEKKHGFEIRPDLLKQAVLFLTNKEDATIISAYKALKGGTADQADTYLLYHKRQPNIPESILCHDPFTFDDSILSSLNYTPLSGDLVPGSNHFPLFAFYLKYPDYNYYWYIEDDVRYGNEWKSFFSFFSDNNIQSDFLTCHVRSYIEDPHWYWWNTLKHPIKVNIPEAARLLSFNPIFRISKKAIQFLHQELLSGWIGHHEVLLPTLLKNAGFRVNDFGGTGKFVLPKCKARFYRPAEQSSSDHSLNSGSMRFRPFIQDNEMTESLLYHPVKPKGVQSDDWQLENQRIR